MPVASYPNLGTFSEAEQRLINEVGKGAEADLHQTQSLGGGEGRQAVSAGVIRMLCLGQHPEGRQLGHVRVIGAQIKGPLHVARAYLPIPLRFTSCTFEEALDLSDARASQPIEFIDCDLPLLTAHRLESRADVVIERVRLPGTLALAGAEIAGDLRV